MCDYKPGILENSAKMVLLFHLIEESVRKGDKLLVFRLENVHFSSVISYLSQAFLGCSYTYSSRLWLCPPSASCSQSLSTLTVIEDFLAKRPVPPSPNRDRPQQNWVRNLNYYSKWSLTIQHLVQAVFSRSQGQVTLNCFSVRCCVYMVPHACKAIGSSSGWLVMQRASHWLTLSAATCWCFLTTASVLWLQLLQFCLSSLVKTCKNNNVYDPLQLSYLSKNQSFTYKIEPYVFILPINCI